MSFDFIDTILILINTPAPKMFPSHFSKNNVILTCQPACFNQNSAESGVAPAPGWGDGGTGATSTSAMGKVLV